MIEVCLGGRAAELFVCGEALAGAGGSEESDLARASNLAFALEASLGYGSRTPLLYRNSDDYTAETRFSPDLSTRVNHRLEAAHAAVTSLIRRNLHPLNDLVGALLRQGTLEGSELDEMLAEMRSQIDHPDPSAPAPGPGIAPTRNCSGTRTHRRRQEERS
jgi:cell division protease FtsH